MSDFKSDPAMKCLLCSKPRHQHYGRLEFCEPSMKGNAFNHLADAAPSVSSSAPPPTWDEMASMFPDNSKRANRPRGSSAEPAPPTPLVQTLDSLDSFLRAATIEVAAAELEAKLPALRIALEKLECAKHISAKLLRERINV